MVVMTSFECDCDQDIPSKKRFFYNKVKAAVFALFSKYIVLNVTIYFFVLISFLALCKAPENVDFPAMINILIVHSQVCIYHPS
jgi:hypothetical protein